MRCQLHFARIEGVRTAQTIQVQLRASSPGDYLVLALANMTETAGNGTAGLRLVDSESNAWPVASAGIAADRAHFSMPRSPWQSFFLARVRTLDNTSQTFALGFDHGIDHPDDRTSYGYFDLVRTAAAVEYATTVTTGSAGVELRAKESVIIVLGLCD